MRARFAGLTFDSERRELARDGHPVALNPKAFDLLAALVESWPSALSKEVLYERLWPGVFVEMGNLHNLVSDIRLAINDEDRTVIRTIHRFGYALGPEPERGTPPIVHLIIGARELPLHDGQHVISREMTGTPDVSRRHALLIVQAGRVTIEDLDSKNGTWIAGKRIKGPVVIHDDQEVVFGRTHTFIRFTGGGGETLTVNPPTGSRE